MQPSLATLRQTPQPIPSRFLAAHPGCWIQYYDDTEVKDPSKALSAPSFDTLVARRKQQTRCAVCFSLQAFGKARTKEHLLSFRNLGVDVDLVSAPERRSPSVEDIDKRKEEYLARCLLPFPLKPHWLIETGHGFHIIFRIMPQRSVEGISEAVTLNHRLVSLLHGDENAALLTQVLRVPRTYQFKDPQHPFLCRLLIDHASTIAPYPLHTVRSVLDAWEVFHRTNEPIKAPQLPPWIDTQKQSQGWREGLNGVSAGSRNATAASVIGAILGRVPEELWETAGWGGLKEWNSRNAVALPERELRSVFLSIARREKAKRQPGERVTPRDEHSGLLVLIEVRIEDGAGQPRKVELTSSSSSPAPDMTSPGNLRPSSPLAPC